MKHQAICVGLLALVPLVTPLCWRTAQAEETAAVRFNRDIRPILSGHCYACHGPDAGHREADLRLDQPEGIALAFGPSRDESEAWRRITSNDPYEQMPPPEFAKPLTADQIALLRRWVEQGAPWEGHWSFVPPSKPPVPAVTGRVQNPIDSFVQRRLQEVGIESSPPADRSQLLRRVYLDLIGLPPTTDQMEAFLQDARPDAYERVVDRLLASPHFGERMALVWMDAARYGDSSVFHADGPRDMWPWRDWVIQAYNSNKPFDQFTIEQLAGDLLPDATLEQKIATGFNRNNATTDEGGAIAEEFRVEYAVDRVKTTSLVWLGLSLECAQCHDHKYDPISQREYYQFFAYFNQAADPGMQTRNGNQAPLVDVIQPTRLARAEDLRQQQEQLLKQRQEYVQTREPAFRNWVEQAKQTSTANEALSQDLLLYLPLDQQQDAPLFDPVAAAQRGTIQGAARWSQGRHARAFSTSAERYLDLGKAIELERTDAFSYGAWIKPDGDGNGTVLARLNVPQDYRGFDLHLADGHIEVHLVHQWPDNAIKVRTQQKLQKDQWQHVWVSYDGSSQAAGVTIYLDGQPQTVDVHQDQLQGTIHADVPLYVGRRHADQIYAGLVDDVRIYRRCLSADEVSLLVASNPVELVRVALPASPTSTQLQWLRERYLHEHDESYRQMTADLESLAEDIAAYAAPVSTVMVMQDLSTPRPTYILDRGNYASPLKNEPLEPGVPSALPPLPSDAPNSRLALAQWLVRPDHPLTARVAVNRYWAMLFGDGIVRTVEDFGSQGEWPSHPDLLDWLAVDFVESGWDIKRAIRQMVTSATYRQSSRVPPELLQRDPDNRLLARGPRFRLSAELIRDQALAVSGLLVRQIGGPSVKPYQPPGLWNEVSLSGNVRFVQDHGAKLYRRGLYTYIKRSAPSPALTILDAPTREKCVLRRSRTNTPLQALLVLNDPQYVEAARALAQRALHQPQMTLTEQITWAYRQATGLSPSDETRQALLATFQTELAVFQADLARAEQLLSVGESPRDSTLDTARHAAMTVISSILLNLNETLTRG